MSAGVSVNDSFSLYDASEKHLKEKSRRLHWRFIFLALFPYFKLHKRTWKLGLRGWLGEAKVPLVYEEVLYGSVYGSVTLNFRHFNCKNYTSWWRNSRHSSECTNVNRKIPPVQTPWKNEQITCRRPFQTFLIYFCYLFPETGFNSGGPCEIRYSFSTMKMV